MNQPAHEITSKAESEIIMDKVDLMSYLDEFRALINGGDLGQFLKIWEEYCLSDHLDGEEFIQILEVMKNSIYAPSFAQFADTALALWQKIESQEVADKVLALIIDLQSSNNPLYADLAIDLLQRRYGTHPNFSEMLRIVGLRQKRNFKGAISNFILLTHLGKGKFVFHTGGWGVGEVMDFSMLREHISIEFEGISAVKDLSFSSAFASLKPLSSDHFLAQRFGNPDRLEKQGKEDPVMLISLLLQDLGPKTAADIKDELCELVIPESEWTKWWQNARGKLKKDVHIQSPKTAREPFILRKEALSHDKQFALALEKTQNVEELILTIYNFTRDFPDVLKNPEITSRLQTELQKRRLPITEEISLADQVIQIQIAILLEDLFPESHKNLIENACKGLEKLEQVINRVSIISYKKRLLTTVRAKNKDWRAHFLHLLFVIEQNSLRDYLLKELLEDKDAAPLLHEKLGELLHKMNLFPEAFFWYFQKIIAKTDLPYADPENRRLFLEAYCVLLHYIENKEEYRELSKKMYQLLCGKRYLVVREIIEGGSIAFLKEFLLLASKCYSFSKSDIRILHSLCEVVQPGLKKHEVESSEEDHVIWTTAEGYRSLQERLQYLGTTEIVENAKEIETARSYGDLRENSEYKFALERRARLQGELKTLSDQLNLARVLTPADINTAHVSPGTIVEITDSKGNRRVYTLLGPWDADVEKNILSFQSKLAEVMLGLRVQDEFEFQNEKYIINSIKSYL